MVHVMVSMAAPLLAHFFICLMNESEAMPARIDGVDTNKTLSHTCNVHKGDIDRRDAVDIIEKVNAFQ